MALVTVRGLARRDGYNWDDGPGRGGSTAQEKEVVVECGVVVGEEEAAEVEANVAKKERWVI